MLGQKSIMVKKSKGKPNYKNKNLIDREKLVTENLSLVKVCSKQIYYLFTFFCG